MDVSIFLAKIFGIYLVIIGLVYFFKRDFLRQVLRDVYKNSAVVAISAVLNILIGLLIVLNHNIWEFSWKLVVTLIGYLSLFKGVFNLFAPQVGQNLVQKILKKDLFVYSGVISLALGVYLLYHGYF